MIKKAIPEKGKMEINGHKMEWEIIRSQTPSAFGINGSRIYELNIYRDGTLTADFDKRWIKVPFIEDAESNGCLEHLLNTYGKENKKVKKGSKKNA